MKHVLCHLNIHLRSPIFLRDVPVHGFLFLDELGALVQSGCLGGLLCLEQRAGGAAGQLGAVAVQGEAVAVRGAGADRQQVVVAGDVAVPGQVVRVLRVTGNHRAASSLDDTDSWLWERAREREEEFKQC